MVNEPMWQEICSFCVENSATGNASEYRGLTNRKQEFVGRN